MQFLLNLKDYFLLFSTLVLGLHNQLPLSKIVPSPN